MLEPSDLAAAVNRLLIGLGQIASAAVLMLLIAMQGHMWSTRLAVLSLGATTITYALQVDIRYRLQIAAIWIALFVSWTVGAAAVLLLLMGA